MLRVLRIALPAVIALLIVPIAVNVGTGGKPPSWLEPYTKWLWPAAVAGVLLVITLEIWRDWRRARKGEISVRRPNDPRNIDLALHRVAEYVNGRQRGSLAGRILELALDERPSAVLQPTHLVQRVSGEEFQLSAGLHIAEVFRQMNESMLILGDPGAGKTTLLLDLAASLTEDATATGQATPTDVDRESSATGRPIPVVVDLADWSRIRRGPLINFGARQRGPRDFISWLLATLAERYSIPEQIGRIWLRENQFILLLDGLDEVRDGDRERCVDEINNLEERWGVTRMAVCSRVADYDRLAAKLRLQGAIVVRPLTKEQIGEYLTTVSPRLAGIASTLGADEELWELLTTPLMLNIMVLAHGTRTAQAAPEVGDLPIERDHLFDSYVIEVLARRRFHEARTPEQTLRALKTLAAASTSLDVGVEVVGLSNETFERALDPQARRVMDVWISRIGASIWISVSATAMAMHSSALAGLIVALAAWALLGLFWLGGASDHHGPTHTVNQYAIVGYLIGVTALSAGLVFGSTSLVESFSGPSAIAVAAIIFGYSLTFGAFWFSAETGTGKQPQALRQALLYIAGPGTAIAATVLLFGAPATALQGWAVGISGMFGLFPSLMMSGVQPSATSGGTGRLTSSVPGSVAALLFIVAVTAPFLTAEQTSKPFWLPLAGWLMGLAFGIVPGAFAYVLLAGPLSRLAMLIAGEPVPWRSKFLQFATDRSLLTLTNGEYRFTHLLVRDHLAQCDPQKLARAVLLRRTQLGVVPLDA